MILISDLLKSIILSFFVEYIFALLKYINIYIYLSYRILGGTGSLRAESACNSNWGQGVTPTLAKSTKYDMLNMSYYVIPT